MPVRIVETVIRYATPLPDQIIGLNEMMNGADTVYRY